MHPTIRKVGPYRLLAITVGLFCLTSCDVTRTDSTTDERRNRTTVTKETRLREGTDPFRETVYREEVAKEIAQIEQSRVLSLPAAEAMGGLLGAMSTGNPILDVLLGVLSAAMAGKGAAKVADKLTKKKDTKNA